MIQPLVVIGGGGMGRSVLDVINAVNEEPTDAGMPQLEVVGVLDDGQPDEELLAARDVRFIGRVSKLEDMAGDVGYLIGIRSPSNRRSIDEALVKTGRPSPSLVHPNVSRGFDVQLGPGCIISSHVSMEDHIRLGRHVHVNQNSTIGHDCRLFDYVTVSPLVAVSHDVTAKDSVFIGTGASINQGLTLHRASTIGAGAAVIRDVMGRSTVVGVPARAIRGR